MMSSRHLGQYKGNFYTMDEVLKANQSSDILQHSQNRPTGDRNLQPAKAPVTRMRFHIVTFSNRSTLVSIFKCLRFHNRLHRFRVNRR